MHYDSVATPADTSAGGETALAQVQRVRTVGPCPELLFTPDASERLHRLMSSRLKECRERLGLSQSVVSGRTGVARSAISDIERGVRRVEALELARFAFIYGMPLGYFVGEDLDPDGHLGSDAPAEAEVVRAVAGLTAVMSVADRLRMLDYARLLHGAAVAVRTRHQLPS